MTTNGHADTAGQEQMRLALSAMLIPIFFVIAFAVCIIGVYHKPHPNDIELGVVGPPAQTAPVRAGLAKAGGSAFEISAVATVAEATRDVRQRDLQAAFVPSANPQQPATAIVARAGGRLVATATESFLRSVTASQGGQLVARDVRPLASGDPIGIGVFMFMIVCTICGFWRSRCSSRSRRPCRQAAATRSSPGWPCWCPSSPT
jgi:hypothetical protein